MTAGVDQAKPDEFTHRMTGSVTSPAAAEQIAAVLRPSRQDDQRNRSAWALPCHRENAS